MLQSKTDLYTRKQQWKIVLILFAMIIVAFSLLYTNRLVKKFAIEEREKARIWAEAIKRKSELVKYTGDLFEKLAKEERHKMENWANATKMLITTENNEDRNFYLEVVNSNQNIPVLVVDEEGNIKNWRNVDSIRNVSFQNLDSIQQTKLNQLLEKLKQERNPIVIPYYQNFKDYIYYDDSKILKELRATLDDIISSFISEIIINSATVPVILADSSKNIINYGNIDSLEIKNYGGLQNILAEMEQQNEPITVDLSEKGKNLIYYRESFLLTQLKFFPVIQLGVISLFLIISYFVFSTSRIAEQNQVWVGMAKETAHQLGTPLSSLMAWNEMLKQTSGLENITPEIEKDLQRLNTITERFSKIGSSPDLKSENIVNEIEKSVEYLKSRVSTKVVFEVKAEKDEIKVLLNKPLFEWVLENIFKNAIDAMSGVGKITIVITKENQHIFIDITDTGKGILKSQFKKIFQPGFSTKKRGWGLGLSLVKRIVEQYHGGKIWVKNSEIDKGTTFRILFNIN
jgi:nitrogen fixation/metabolism regulation signal transduction histidine kinase